MKRLPQVDIFPCINVSRKVNSLKRLKITIKFDKFITLSYKNRKICEIPIIFKEMPDLTWYGDLVKIEYNTDESKECLHFGIVDKTLLISSRSNENLIIHGLNLKLSGLKITQVQNENEILDIFSPSIQWRDNAQDTFDEGLQYFHHNIDTDVKIFWRDCWVYHRFNQFHAEGPFDLNWISPCRASPYQYDLIAMWDTLHVVEDLKYKDLKSSMDMLALHFKMIRDSDGMCAQDQKLSRISKSHFSNRSKKMGDIHGLNYDLSQPPLWAQTLRSLLEFLEHAVDIVDMRSNKGISENVNVKDLMEHFINATVNNYFPKMVKNIDWWEKNRFMEDYGLFGYPNLSIHISANESGLDNCPRFYKQYDPHEGSWSDFPRGKNRSMLCPDLSSQMYNYYENMAYFCEKLSIDSADPYKEKMVSLKKSMLSNLWDDERKIFLDLDLDMQCLQPMIASSHFWAYYMLKDPTADQEYIDGLNLHLLDENEFYTPLPIPTIAVNHEFYGNNMWDGPVWISQDYWYLLGLKKAGQDKIARDLAVKILSRLSESYRKDHKIYEFYPPLSLDTGKLMRKSSRNGPHPHYVGHMPIHAIYHEIIK